MHTDFAEGTLTHGRVWELKASAIYRTFNAMLVNEDYVVGFTRVYLLANYSNNT